MAEEPKSEDSSKKSGGKLEEGSDASQNSSDKPKLTFMEQLKEARENSEGFGSFLVKAFAIVSVTAGCTVLMALLLLFPIFVFFVGFVNLADCPVNTWIPVYLLVLGAVVIFQNVAFLTKSCCSEKMVACFNCMQLPINIFILVWFILGNIWVYGSLAEVNTTNETIPINGTMQENPDYCDPLCYWLAFWLITLVYVVLVLTCCAAVAAVVFLKKFKGGGEPGEETPIVENEGSAQ